MTAPTHDPPSIAAAVGVDLGGTWIRVHALDAAGRSVRHVKGRAVSLRDLPSYLEHLFRRWGGLHPARLAVASRGVWTPFERAQMAKQLKRLARRIEVISDVEAAWLAAFGGAPRRGRPAVRRGLKRPSPRSVHRPPPAAHGILVVSGTGSIAYARDADGCAKRAGGLGPYLGDEGSGFWIGRAWLRAKAGTAELPKVLHLLRAGPSPVRTIAGRATRVIHLAQRGQPAAGRIVRQAQAALAELVGELAGELHWPEGLPVSWSGRLLDHAWFRGGFAKAVRKHPKIAHRPVLWHKRRMNAALAVARSALYG